jgi:soluble lytic murein transglycosylase-like protein
MHHTAKFTIVSIILLGVALLGATGMTGSQQQLLPKLASSPGAPPADTANIPPEIVAAAPPMAKEFTTPRHTGTALQRKGRHHRLSLSYEPIIHRAADEFKIDPALIKAVIMAESRYNPKAVSKRGARGLMQLMPATAKSLGVADSFDPEDNIYGGSLYLKTLIDRFDGDITLALAAYNAGSRQVKKYGGVPPFKQTRNYIHKVFAYHQLYKEDA